MKKNFSEIPLHDKVQDVVNWLREHKATRVLSLDLTQEASFTEALVIASAASLRQARSLAEGMGKLCRDRNYELLRTEGYSAGQWILLDMNDLVVNIFFDPVRDLYDLESLWSLVPQEGEEISTAAPAQKDGQA